MDRKKVCKKSSAKKKMMSIELKREIIEKHEPGVRVVDLSRQYGRSTSMTCSVLKRKESIKSVTPAKGLTIISKLRTSLHENMEKLLMVWALVDTSTAYSNCNHDLILEERVYGIPYPAERFLEYYEKEDDEALLQLRSEIKPDFPNHYVFCKYISENLIVEKCTDIPSAIIRPSLISSAWKGSKRAEERHLERIQELEFARIESRRKTENEIRIREARHKEEMEARLKVEEETRLNAGEQARPKGRKQEQGRLKAEEEAKAVE
ncbi:fatty acyl-CoA reductase [Trichonephila inaurata madagascariensis]|uniref:Fatty acyl-CoA reductase n=1 Tax=Trichonephila inaurata madagascariensis TaxID=2747483 RepID=A0A8X6IT14_9ARAC|nr:fatty acyl-CoA reductase [Trichonephila inaurata madagascariensis]